MYKLKLNCGVSSVFLVKLKRIPLAMLSIQIFSIRVLSTLHACETAMTHSISFIGLSERNIY